jgi:hypothetical protein
MGHRRMKTRWATMAATGLALAASAGLAGAGSASAVAPASHITYGATWTVVEKHSGCEHIIFASNGTFTAPSSGGDAGTWSGGRSTINMTWTSGLDTGLIFSGTYISTKDIYKGTMRGTVELGARLVSGVPKTGC